MRALDTNVLVRLLTRDDPQQTQAAENFISQGAWVPLLVLAETVWVLESVYGLNRKRIAAAVEMLLGHASLVVQDAEAAQDALGDFRAASSASFTDCLVLAAARRAGHVPLGTFDRALARLPGAQRLT
jgi:predicted nucleic-acid-binding protein